MRQTPSEKVIIDLSSSIKRKFSLTKTLLINITGVPTFRNFERKNIKVVGDHPFMHT